MEDPYVVVTREDDDRLGRGEGPVRLRELDGVPLVTYAQMRAVHSIENRLGRPELREQIVFRSNDNGTILGLAAEGVGAAVISWLSVNQLPAGVRTRALEGVNPRIVGIAWHRDRYRIPASEAFVQLAAHEAGLEQSRMREALRGADAAVTG
jgi:DNA-binding transcriptional LysR family regulator